MDHSVKSSVGGKKTLLFASPRAFMCSNVTFASLNLLAALSQLRVSIHSKQTAQETGLWGLAQGCNIGPAVILSASHFHPLGFHYILVEIYSSSLISEFLKSKAFD